MRIATSSVIAAPNCSTPGDEDCVANADRKPARLLDAAPTAALHLRDVMRRLVAAHAHAAVNRQPAADERFERLC